MKRPRRALVPQRQPIFLGCEGESEQSYGALLGRLVEARHRRIHLDSVLLRPGGGDPLALMELAVAMIEKRAARNDPYVIKAVLLDSDKRGQSYDRDMRAMALAQQYQIRLIWQEPCHEALLLRHLNPSLRPPTPNSALTGLQRHWPDYRKGRPALWLAARVDEESVRRASAVEGSLAAFLTDIQFGRD